MDAQQRIVELEAELAVAQARITEQDARIITLTKQVEVLLERSGQNSCNSHKPPSSDPPGAGPQRKPNQEGKKRKRGGQRGHRGTFRELLPTSQVDEVVNWTSKPVSAAVATLVTTFELGLPADADDESMPGPTELVTNAPCCDKRLTSGARPKRRAGRPSTT